MTATLVERGTRNMDNARRQRRSRGRTNRTTTHKRKKRQTERARKRLQGIAEEAFANGNDEMGEAVQAFARALRSVDRSAEMLDMNNLPEPVNMTEDLPDKNF